MQVSVMNYSGHGRDPLFEWHNSTVTLGSHDPTELEEQWGIYREPTLLLFGYLCLIFVYEIANFRPLPSRLDEGQLMP